jgi:hypothetical protein
MRKYGREGGPALTTYTTGERVNEYIERKWGSDPDGTRLLSRNAIDNFLKGKTHTPDKKLHAIKAYLLSISGFVKPEDFALEEPIDRAALAMCEFYGIKAPEPAISGSEQPFLFTSQNGGRKLTFEFTFEAGAEADAKAVYMPAHGSYSYEWDGTEPKPEGFMPIRAVKCTGFGIHSYGFLYLFLRSDRRREPHFFAGQSLSGRQAYAWFSVTPGGAELSKLLPHVYEGRYSAQEDIEAERGQA